MGLPHTTEGGLMSVDENKAVVRRTVGMLDTFEAARWRTC
jgi:hypothetical protein